MPEKYARDHDSIETTLKETHETVGRLNALIADLTSQINTLKAETEKGAQ